MRNKFIFWDSVRHKRIIEYSRYLLVHYFAGGAAAFDDGSHGGRLPCIASDIRGNGDLIVDGVGGYLKEPEDVDGLAEVIAVLAADQKS